MLPYMFNDKKLGPKQEIDWIKHPNNDHRVQFYSSNKALLSSLLDYINQGLQSDEVCLVIAKADTLRQIEKSLKLSTSELKLNSKYIPMDAETTLAKIMVNELPDKRQFFDIVGKKLTEVAKSGKHIRVYCEMTAMLWQKGNKPAVLKLEDLWNQLAKRRKFALYCTYPELHFVTYGEVMDEIKHHHHEHAPT